MWKVLSIIFEEQIIKKRLYKKGQIISSESAQYLTFCSSLRHFNLNVTNMLVDGIFKRWRTSNVVTIEDGFELSLQRWNGLKYEDQGAKKSNSVDKSSVKCCLRKRITYVQIWVEHSSWCEICDARNDALWKTGYH